MGNEIDALLDQRGSVYGDPLTNHTRIAGLWSSYLETPITPAQASMCMMLVKVARLCQTPDHEDSIKDAVGYLEVYRRIMDTT
jgi:hypothetical protein